MKISKRKAPYDHCPKVNMLTVEGLKTAQSDKVVDMLALMEEVPLIIEIGTCRGGFSLLLRNAFPNAEIITWDISEWQPKQKKLDLFTKYEISYIVEDCFNSKMLNELLKTDRKKIVFCDGGQKAAEFNRFAPLINSGDIIGVHDYFESKEDYDNEIWTVCEVEFNQLNMNGQFEQVYKHSMQAVWGLFKRK